MEDMYFKSDIVLLNVSLIIAIRGGENSTLVVFKFDKKKNRTICVALIKPVNRALVTLMQRE